MAHHKTQLLSTSPRCSFTNHGFRKVRRIADRMPFLQSNFVALNSHWRDIMLYYSNSHIHDIVVTPKQKLSKAEHANLAPPTPEDDHAGT